jgi:hypothetical protein
MIDSDEAPPQSDPILTKAKDLVEIAAKLLETARKLPPGQDPNALHAGDEVDFTAAQIGGVLTITKIQKQ